MKEKVLYCIWFCMYALCVGLSYLPDPQGASRIALALIAALFFVPGAILLYDARKAENKKGLLRIRLLSIASLALTVLVLIITFLSASASAAVGDALYDILILVSAPMICSQYWVLSLFLWACLLFASFPKKAQK